MAQAQDHLDPLSALDAAFLFQERPNAHMHIGGVAIFDGPPPAWDDFLEHVRSRLDRVPRYRQKLAEAPLGLGRPRWIDDPSFNLEYHVLHKALPSPGDESALRRLIARIYSQRLDRAKPLWELLLIEGLADDRFALLTKTHHSVVDGISGVDITAALFDITQHTPGPDPGSRMWVARPEPSAAELAAMSVNGTLRDVSELPLRAAGTIGDRLRLRRAAQGAGEAAMTLLRPAPPSPLNVKIGPHRRVAFVRTDLDAFKQVKDVFGGTVNDVVLAVTAGAIRHWMHARGLKTEGTELRAGVPVSTRGTDAQGTLGNQLTQLIAPLPVDVADPVARLRIVQDAMTGLKESRQALGAELIAGAQDFAPPTILAQSTRLNFSTRAYNVLVTNIPGPQVPLYLMGRELRSIYPLAFLAGDRAAAVAVMSYNGMVGFGLIGDYDALGDIDVLADGLSGSLQEYVTLAERRARRGRTSRRAPKKQALAKKGR
ncbi:MAG TPA: wax ester/triacylglycerol synthase family O-acyltransferase [Solirubrobacteraceae bacterium]|nr:wax ester/triacylglycerol synthase family O-acyltransferase [Solirubrobacteraceae bacterium]